MNPTHTLRPTTLAHAILLITSFTAASAACSANAPSPAAQAQAPKATSMERDEIYRTALKNAEAINAVYKQQPNHYGALQRYLDELRGNLDALSESADREESGAQAAGPSRETRGAETPPPFGPVTPSAEPTPEEEAKRREEATLGKFRATPPLGDPLASRTLAGVNAQQIREACRRASEQATKVETLLQSGEPEPQALGTALADLRDAVFRMSRPVAESPQGNR